MASVHWCLLLRQRIIILLSLDINYGRLFLYLQFSRAVICKRKSAQSAVLNIFNENKITVMEPDPRFYFLNLILRFYDYITHVGGLLSPSFWLITLLSSAQCSQFERFHVLPIQMVNKTSSFKTKLIGNNVKPNKVNCNTL